MGVLPLRCITSDPSTTILYGLSYAYNFTDLHTTPDTQYFVLFKSQPNPANLSDTQWSVVSTYPASTYRLDMINRIENGFSCAVSKTGVFTAFASYYPNMRPGEENSAEGALEGLRYDPAGPAMKPEYDVRDGGRWSSVDVKSDYNRSQYPRYSGQKLHYTADGTLVHAYIDDSSGYIRFGLVNETESSPTLTYVSSYQGMNLQLGPKSSISFEPTTNQLFVYSPATETPGSVPVLASIPLTNGITPPPTGSPATLVNTFEANSTYDCRFSATILSTIYEGGFYLSCDLPDYSMRNVSSQLAALKPPFTNNTSSVQTINSYYTTFSIPNKITHFQAIGGHLPGQTPFVVLMSCNTVSEINLVTGLPQWSINVRVNGTLGSNTFMAPPTNDRNRRSSEALIIGVYLGAAMLLFVLVGVKFVSRRRAKHLKTLNGTSSGAGDLVEIEVDAGAIELGDPRRTEYRYSQDDYVIPSIAPPVYSPRNGDGVQ